LAEVAERTGCKCGVCQGLLTKQNEKGEEKFNSTCAKEAKVSLGGEKALTRVVLAELCATWNSS
jgi:hypothetical protein